MIKNLNSVIPSPFFCFGLVPFSRTSILVGWNQSSIFHLEFMDNFTLSNLRFKWEEINLTRNDTAAKKIVSDIFLDLKKFSLILKGTSFNY